MVAEHDRQTPYCILPWVHLYGAANGKIYPCCFSADSSDQNFHTTRHLVSDQDSHDFSSLAFASLRKEFLTGSPPSFCDSCTNLERSGGHSRRSEAQMQFAEFHKRLLQGEDIAKGGVRHAQFSIGNVCNLKCRMCNPYSSSKLIREWSELGWMENFQPPTDAYDSDEFWERFLDKNPNLRTIVLAGGETFLTPRVLKLIDLFIARGVAKHLEIEIHTNFTQISADVLQKLHEFRLVKLMASIDGYQKVNTYIRYPANWLEIEQNLQKFHALCSQSKFRLSINVTVQAYNILGLVDLLRFALGFENLAQCKLNLLRQPEELQIAVLPWQTRRVAAERLREFLAVGIPFPKVWREEKRNNFVANLQALLALLKEENESLELQAKFVQRTLAVDQYRSHWISHHIPDLVKELPELGAASATPQRISSALPNEA